MSGLVTDRLWPLLFGLLVAVCLVSDASAEHDPKQPASGADAQAAAEDGDHEDGDHGGGDHDEHAGGVPLDFMADLAIWSLVVFLVLLAVLKKFAWGPLLEGLDSREGGIRQQIADAEAAHEKAKVLLAEHEYKMDKVQDEVRDILAEARRDAEHTQAEMVAAARIESEAMKNRAVQDIERARDDALEQLFAHMSESVAQATEHVLGRAIGEADRQKLINDALAEFSPSNN